MPDMSNTEIPSTSGDLERPGRFPKLRSLSSEGRQTASITLGADRCTALVEVAKEGTPTLFDLLKTAWPMLLADYIDSKTVSFGILSGDTDNEVAEQWFATLDLKQPISKVVTLEKLQEWPSREVGQSGQFNTFISRRGNTAFESKGNQTSLIGDILVIADDTHNSSQIDLYYHVSVLGPREAQHVITTLGAVLDSLVFSYEQPIAELNLLHDHHRDQIRSWNSHVPEKAINGCIHTLFQLQCAERPGSQAVCAWDGCFTYAEVDQMSDRVAARLQKYGIQEESIVPILLEKSKWVAVAMLGVLKVGAAFILMDVSYPTGRLLDICEDIQAQVLIQSVEAQAISRPMNVIAVDEGVMDWESSPPLRTAISPSNAAYVSYTSGSMGKPKGVIIEHGSFCTNALTTSKVHNLSSSSRVLQYASFAFDVSIQECLTPLLLGGCTCIPSEAQRINDLAESCVDLQVNWAELTPSVARLLQPEEVPSIKTLVLGGESTSSIDISKWQHLQLISAYGPAECTIVATVQPHVKEPNNIGRSYGGTCWIVNKDNHHRLLPIGAVGELVIGGPIVGRGYLNQPAQTEAVFFMNPVWAATFGLDRDYRYYRTGDLVRYNADGDIIYCGRKDTQVKIHGQRVELGEIEYHAQSCLSEDITVELGMRGNQRPFLVLFMAPKGQVTRDICSGSLFCEPNNEFRHRILHVKARLRNSLPDYMIPAVYIPLSGTPLSRTGKVDRKLLRSILSQLSDAQIRKYRISDPTYTLQTPATSAEKTLRELFATVLSLPEAEIGIDDSIFQLGGDSITAISLVAEARKRGLEMTAASIFQSQSIRKLVANTDDICTRSTSPVQPFSLLNKEKDSLIPQAAQQCKISPSQVEDIYPCTPVQEAMMGSTMRNPSSFQAQFRFHLPMTLDVARFKDAWGTVLAARPILRTRIVQLDTPHALQVVVRSEERIPWHSVKHVQEVTQTLMLLGDPLIQLCMVSEPDERVQLTFILTMHHALFDKWSYKIILEEVEAVYRGLSVGWQSFTPFIKYIYCSDAANSKGFWKAEFMGLKAPEFPAAPAHSHSRTSVRRLHCHFQVPHWPPSSYTLSTVIRLAYAILISRSTHSHDIVFGVTVNGRNAPVSSIYDLAAPTIATLPLRTVLQPDISVQEMLVRMQEHATRLIPFEHTGIRWVKASSAEAALACDFKSLLVIQPPTRRGASHGLFGEALENDDELKFSTHPLTLICEIENNGWIHVTAVINSAVISPDETQALLRQFAGIFVQINDNLERPVSSIISDDTVVAASGYDSDKLLSLRELEMKAQYYLESLPGIDADTVVLEELPSAMLAVFVCDSRVNSNETWETDLIKKPSRTVRHVLSKLGEYLRQSMPDALTPFLCLPIKTLPKDSAGQPDREALRLAASNLCRKSQREFMFPVTSEPWCPTPSQLPTAQNIIARVLGVKADDVGSQDDFFTLGGDSSAAMQMVMLCKKEGFNLTVRDVFQERKIGRIASRFQPLATIKPPPDPNLDLSLSTRFSLLRLTCDYEKDKFETAVKAQLGIRSMDALEDAYPCTTVHEGLLWTQSHEPMVYQSHTIWEVTATGRHSPVCPFHLRDAWLILVRRHPALRTILVNNVFPEKTCKRIHIVLRDSPDDVAVFTGITNEMMHRPNLQSGACCLPYKFTIYQTQQNRVYCKLEGNQAFLDATSVSTLLQELAEAYSETLPSAPGPPYRSVVEYFQGMCNVARHTTYWKKQMATAEPCIFPSIRREGTRQDTLNVARIEIGDAIDLRQYCTTRGFTLSNVYQVAWGLTLRFYTSQNMICFGTLVSGRDLPLPDVHQTIGPFFNVLPCLLDLSRPDRLLQILRGNQAEIVNRLVNQHCSLTDILRHSNHFGQRLFNTCLSLEQQLSSLQVNSVRFTEIDTREPTEYILLSVIDKQATFEARLTYFSSIMSDKQAAEVVSRFAAYVSHILRNTDTM